LGQQFENKSIRKRYQAIVIGQPTAKEGQIHEKIDNKIAITNFSLVRTVLSLKTGQLSLLNLFPITGRTHQLRIHLSNQGMPILGDPLYTKEAPLLKGKGLFLCAVEIDFNHPINGEALNFTIQPPAKFEYRLQQEARRWQKRQGI
jgi:23S rRNA-/tRNA-specific pseudouridylate synthase